MEKRKRMSEDEVDSVVMEKRKRMIDDEVHSFIEVYSFMEKCKRMTDDERLGFARLLKMELDKRGRSMTQLPSDLLQNIFLRLSVTDLLSLRAVCKTFDQLISSNLFVGMHLKDFTKYPKPTTAFIISTDPTASNLNYDPEKRTISVWHDESRFNYWCTHHAIRCHGHHRVIDSYLGYLLVQICDSLCLCNPITRKYHFLPSLCGFSLDFGCWKIAYDDVSEQYKVFGLRIWKNKVCLYVFDVRRDKDFHLPRKTTTVMEVGFNQMDSLIKGSVLVNGILYWLIINPQTWTSCIVSANVTTEELKTRNCHYTPCKTKPSLSIYDNISAANGTFYICQSYHPINYLKLWVLEGVESENPNPRWMLKHKIISPSIIDTPFFHTPRALGVFRDKLLIIIVPSQQYYQYDFTRKEFDKVMLTRGDDIERVLIGDDTKCEMSMGPIDTATRVPVGFIPSTIF